MKKNTRFASHSHFPCNHNKRHLHTCREVIFNVGSVTIYNTVD